MIFIVICCRGKRFGALLNGDVASVMCVVLGKRVVDSRKGSKCQVCHWAWLLCSTMIIPQCWKEQRATSHVKHVKNLFRRRAWRGMLGNSYSWRAHKEGSCKNTFLSRVHQSPLRLFFQAFRGVFARSLARAVRKETRFEKLSLWTLLRIMSHPQAPILLIVSFSIWVSEGYPWWGNLWFSCLIMGMEILNLQREQLSRRPGSP